MKGRCFAFDRDVGLCPVLWCEIVWVSTLVSLEVVVVGAGGVRRFVCVLVLPLLADLVHPWASC